MNFLISGGAGFIGSHVAEFYAKRNDVEKIFLIDNLSRDKLLNKEIKNKDYNWNYLKKYKKIKFYRKDIRNFNFLEKILTMNQIDAVIHTAAQTAVTTSIQNPIEDFENNVIGSFNILEAIRKSDSDPGIIFCSTNKVFGNNINKINIIEGKSKYKFANKFSRGISEDFSVDLCEHTPYGTSKLCSDIYFQEYGHLYGLKTAVFRMSCIYGPRQFGMEDQGWVAHFIISALKNQKINIFGDGKQVRDVLYVSDLVNAYDYFLNKSDQIKHDVFCIGGGPENTLSLLELIAILEIETGKKIQNNFYNWRRSDQKVYISNIQKAKEKLDWSPKIGPKEGIKKVVEWVKSHITLFS